MKTTIDMLLAPDGDFGPDPLAGRDAFLLRTLAEVSSVCGKTGSEYRRLGLRSGRL